jgi:hypothetical protein
MVPGARHEPHWRKEGAPHGGCGGGRRPCMPRAVLVMGAQRQADLPLAHGLPQPPHHREQGPGRPPCGLRQPPRAAGGWGLAPAPPWCARDGLCLRRLAQGGIRPPRGWHRGGEPRPPGRLLGRPQRLGGPPPARAALDLGGRGLRRPAAARPLGRAPPPPRPRHTPGLPPAGGARRSARLPWLGRRQTPPPCGRPLGGRGRPASVALPSRGVHPPRPLPPGGRPGGRARLPPRTRARAHPQRAFPGRLPVGPQAVPPVEAARPPCRARHRSGWAGGGLASP